MQEIREIAKTFGIKTSRQTKLSLIREIQRNEGNNECFATDINAECDQEGCVWRKDCATMSKKQLSAA